MCHTPGTFSLMTPIRTGVTLHSQVNEGGSGRWSADATQLTVDLLHTSLIVHCPRCSLTTTHTTLPGPLGTSVSTQFYLDGRFVETGLDSRTCFSLCM